ncbi:cell division protein FtsQ [Palleronia aestuarii]|uniref:Cell division protein FtsQ n=1 Tax=Palleronia aestuarii TaxID=568105 RepID=A0A2W7NSJ6_9RHOB|nr:cell division protein FtsQ/DivIB [Palleronia aestuarii]PZX16256.1 cell division protein FtsQ [Palleronia aestuarii]
MRPLNRPAVRRDPAPSRLAYRLHRLALTPSVRRGFTVGLPLAVATLILTLALADADRRQALGARVAAWKLAIAQREEFMVRQIAFRGGSDATTAAIRERLNVDLPASSFDLDLAAMREAVTSIDAVREAELSILSGGTLQIAVEERIPALVWRGPEGLVLLDAEGHPTGALQRRRDRADLPLVAGDGAPEAVPEALAIIAAAHPLADRVRGLLRVGARRWDLVLDRGQRVMLPETRPVAALEEAIAIHEAQDLLSRDVLRVDMRTPSRPTIRMAEASARTMRQIRLGELGGD